MKQFIQEFNSVTIWHRLFLVFIPAWLVLVALDIV